MMTRSLYKPAWTMLLGVTALLLSMAFVVGNLPLGVPVVLLLTAAWGVLVWRNGRLASWPVPLLVLAAAFTELPISDAAPSDTLLWRYGGVLMVLLLWDAHRFEKRLQDASESAVQPLIVAHFQRVGLLALLALAALALQQWLPLSFNFDLALLSVLVLAFGLNALIRRLQA